jgi:hypothetical protein
LKTLKAHGLGNKPTEKGKEFTMNENEMVLEGTENVEPTTEETEVQVEQIADESAEKLYTQKDFDERVSKAIEKKMARREAKIRKEYERKYGDLENVLRAGTGEETVEKITDTFKSYYEGKGVSIPSQPQYNSKDIEILARAEAQEIIDSGLEDVTEELDRLTELGVPNMSAKEKAMYRQLADYHKTTTQSIELEKIGVTGDVYNSPDFKAFAGKFSASTPITEIYGIYAKTQPQKQIQTAGSMKNVPQKDTGVKDFYTVEEARRFTKADFDKNPELFKAVERSMTKW